MKKTKQSYLVFYTKGCSPHIKRFKTLRSAQLFCGKFKRSEDDWIDFIVSGEIVQECEGAEGYIK